MYLAGQGVKKNSLPLTASFFSASFPYDAHEFISELFVFNGISVTPRAGRSIRAEDALLTTCARNCICLLGCLLLELDGEKEPLGCAVQFLSSRHYTVIKQYHVHLIFYFLVVHSNRTENNFKLMEKLNQF